MGISKMIKDLNIQKVIIDEASQTTELESFLVSEQAEQIVLIGD